MSWKGCGVGSCLNVTGSEASGCAARDATQEVFLVEGHTDAVGDDASNLDLSQRRAEAIKQALTQYYAINPENLRTVGYGERYLKVPTQEPEEENRRITIRRITPAIGELQG